MPVKVTFRNYKDHETDESSQAQKLVAAFKKLDVDGDVFVASNVTVMSGMPTKDIDIVIVGWLDRYEIPEYERPIILKGADARKQGLIVHSFCVAIELKMHDQVALDGLGQVFVSYKDSPEKKHCATDQNKGQRDALLSAFNRKNVNAFVSFITWLGSIKSDNEDIIEAYQDNPALNIITSDVTIESFFTTLANSNSAKWEDDAYSISCRRSNNNVDSLLITDVLSIFHERKEIRGITRRKMEWICTNNLRSCEIHKTEKVTLLKGRAGTGKTIMLLRFAWNQIQEYQKKCLFLTYNHALLNDINRLSCLCGFPIGEEGMFQAQTSNYFFHSLMVQYKISFNRQANYTAEYEECIEQLRNEIKNKIILEEEQKWDYILVDEAQDWKEIEQEILCLLYQPHQIIVADGVDQFMRHSDFLSPWNQLQNVSKREFYVSLRQKGRIVDFINKYAEENLLDWSISQPDCPINGGRIIIKSSYTFSFHKELLEYCKNNECQPYDLLILMDSKLAKNSKDFFINKAQKNGYAVFDGMCENNTNLYARNEECRLYNYNSCRGIEGWVVVCMNLDRELCEREKFFPRPIPQAGESIEDVEFNWKKKIYTWLLMPLTRPIDTLVITIDNTQSEFAQMLKRIAKEMDDVQIDY